MNIVVFEDQLVSQLFPITTGRPAYAITCAGYRLIDWLEMIFANHAIRGSVRDYLVDLQRCDFPQLARAPDLDVGTTLLVNARLVPCAGNLRGLQRLVDPSSTTPRIVGTEQAIAAAIVATRDIAGLTNSQLLDWLTRIPPDLLAPGNVELDFEWFEFPHHVIDHNLRCFPESLQHRIDRGSYQRSPDNPDVHLGDQVRIGSHVVFDTSGGAVVLDDRVSVGPYTYLRGPIYIGPGSRISENAAIKDEVSISHTCKIGGEVETTIIEPFTNKQHHGFLGHSYLGSWINLGAGTCNSDLKNTYGTVNVQYGRQKVATGMQFMGCVMGDYAKTAINTGIFTGKLIGTASMVYGFATTNVPSFVNYARLFGEMGVLPPDVIVSTQSRMFARRNVQQRPCDVKLIHHMFEQTADERPADLPEDPPAL